MRDRLAESLPPPPLPAETVPPGPAGRPRPAALTPERVLLGVVGTVMAGATVLVARRTGGFSYTLDDPYIHLRVAQQIARGHYGMNPGEASAPASSALWPFLLAPVARWGFAIWAPLALAAACTLASARITMAIVARGWRSLDPAGWRSAAIAGAIVLASGTVAVAFTGMEHSLQIALTLAVFLGVGRVADGESPPRWLWAAIAVLPLVRYEGLVVSGVAVAALLVFGERRRPLLALGAGITGLIAFSGFLAALGLSPVPASILVKASMAGSGSGLSGAITTTGENWAWLMDIGDLAGIALLAAAALLAVALAAGARRLHREVTLLAMSVALLVVHISVFSHEGFMRYQLYAIAAAMAAIASSLPAVARAAVEHVPASSLRSGFLGGALLVVVASLLNGGSGMLWLLLILAGVLVPLLAATVRPLPRSGLLAVALIVVTVAGVPMAERNVELTDDATAIANQQFQMHRFVEAYGRPVAANDIGWVTYDADVAVLDLWGLASPAAREAREESAPGWMDDLMADQGVDVAMIYASWFQSDVPAGWTEVATLRTGPTGMTGDDTVTFYARTDEAADDARAALEAIEPGLPAESRLTLG